MSTYGAEFELSKMTGQDGVKISGEAEGDEAGSSVSDAGDVNGDGFDDIIVGASGADPNGGSSGAAYVVFGKAGGFAATLNLSTLNGTTGFQISGEAANDEAGISVSSAGDVNGDGFDDLIVGAYGANPNGTDSGAAYVVFGRAGGFAATLDLATLDGTTGFQISGEAVDDYAGYSVSSAGDVNGDGFDDLIVGAYGADPNGDLSGAAYVIFGTAGFFPAEVDLAALDGRNGFQISGEAGVDLAGYSVSSAGDINNDGFDDLIVGAYGADPNGSDSGAAYVIYGKQSAAGEGDDTLIGSSGANTLAGLGGNDTLFGKGGNDRLDGGNGNDLLDAGTGTDSLIGGAGDDVYVTDGGDTITEAAGEGTDTVRADVAYTLGANVENLLLTGSGAISGTGNSGANTLTGNGGNNSLDGGGGADRLIGGAGNDTYVTDGGDTITENSGQGTDTVRSSVSLTLGSNLENLVLTGSSAINGTGNSAVNSLTGNGGNNSLNGGAGNDTMTGGGGSDTFVFDKSLGSSNVDRITDYNVAADTMRIDNAVFTGLSTGTLASSAFVKNTSGNAADASDRIIYESDTGKVYFDRDGTGAASKVLVATLQPNLALTNADFVVI